MDRGKAGRETTVIHSVERELLVPGEPDELWEAVADPARLGDWLGGDVDLEPVPGGDLRIRFDHGGERIGFVEELDEEERRFAFWWREPADELATRVEISLAGAPDGDGTLVRVVETCPLATLDLVGVPLPGQGMHGPLALAMA